jgi:hypothetical protein
LASKLRNVLGLPVWQALYDRRPGHDVLERRHVWKQIEMLEYHPRRGAKGCELAVAAFGASSIAKLHFAVADADSSAIGVLKQVDAAQECRFARAARSDDCHYRTSLDAQRYPLQNLKRAECLPEIGNFDHRPLIRAR